ncbi:SGNH/GDSL hydrolase family protein [Tsukamurella pseudospumae]|uniref:SGNH hydrolase-type esterase domain-containing protein n=1 Tax=Tsukamurella pseudospumae TaxID=239498 RepID=A0A138A7T9_9ACTN|nr:SGNH/GDSL hydrolase family protein [Tsukamurella pseudospumae]KXP06485.1 hypothetical protein AXK60_10380 [Tsukamurella pseudospumae]
MRSAAYRALLLASAGLLIFPAPAFAAPGSGAQNPSHRTGAEFVTIGDSYIGTGSVAATIPGDCLQASDSVGRLVAAKMPQVTFGEWACGGADTRDITQRTPMGPQVDALSTSTKYVAVQIGGNDGTVFNRLITNCIVAVTCTQAFRNEAETTIAQLPGRLDTAFAAIARRAPKARIAVLGYVKILPDDPTGCVLEATPGRDAVAFGNRAEQMINDEVAAAARRAGFIYVDPTARGDHSICAPTGQRYVSITGLEPGENGTPFHPTQRGREFMAAKTYAALTAH